MPSPALRVRNFSHVCVRVSDMERSLAFYRDLLGLETIFDVELAGPGLDAVSGRRGAAGRMVGCLVPGGATIELLCFAGSGEAQRGRPPAFGYSNVALSVDDLDAAWAALEARGARPLQRPVEVGGVRMFFLADPDGTPIEIIEFPRGATSSAEHHGR